jgi:hypothetical protein
MGLLAAAGFITGEALMGIGLAVPVAVKHDENALAVSHGKYATLWEPSLLFVGLVLFLLYYLSLKPPAQTANKR